MCSSHLRNKLHNIRRVAVAISSDNKKKNENIYAKHQKRAKWKNYKLHMAREVKAKVHSTENNIREWVDAILSFFVWNINISTEIDDDVLLILCLQYIIHIAAHSQRHDFTMFDLHTHTQPLSRLPKCFPHLTLDRIYLYNEIYLQRKTYFAHLTWKCSLVHRLSNCNRSFCSSSNQIINLRFFIHKRTN